jgi:hypothetical protein
MKSIRPIGEKCIYTRWLMAAVFAVVAVSLMSMMGAPGTRAQAQTPQPECTKSPAPTPTPTVTDEELLLGPAPTSLGYSGPDGSFNYGRGGIVYYLNAILGTPLLIAPTNDTTQLSRSGVIATQGPSNVQSGPCIAAAKK